jgi:hypothetical protein
MGEEKKQTKTMNGTKKSILDVLSAREKGVIKTDQEMEEKIFALLDNQDIYAALFKGDDPKSWYAPLSVWKKDKFDKTFKKWQDDRIKQNPEQNKQEEQA